MNEKYSKPAQRYRDRRLEQKRFPRNTKDNGFDQPENKEREDSKVNWVKPTYSPREKSNRSTMLVHNLKQNTAISTEQNKGAAKRKDQSERRQYQPKENNKPPRSTNFSGRYRPRKNVSNDVSSEPDNRIKHASDKTIKQNHDSVTTQYIKPAVHVQPIQHEESKMELHNSTTNDCTRTKNHQIMVNQSNLVPDDSSLHLQHLLGLHEETEKNDMERPNDKSPAEHTGSTLKENYPVRARTNETTADVPKTELPQNIPLKPGYQNELSSTIHPDSSIQLGATRQQPQQDVHLPVVAHDLGTSKSSTDGNASEREEPFRDNRKNLVDASSMPNDLKAPLANDNPQGANDNPQSGMAPAYCDPKYGYRISVDSLFSTSFFGTTQANKQEDKTFINQKNDTRNELQASCERTIPKTADITKTAEINDNFLTQNNSFSQPSLIIPISNNEHSEKYDTRLVSPKNRSEKLIEPSQFVEANKLGIANTRNDLLSKPEVKNISHDRTFPSQDHMKQPYKPLQTEDTFSQRASCNDLSLFPTINNRRIDVLQEKDSHAVIQHNQAASTNSLAQKTDKDMTDINRSSLTSINYNNIANVNCNNDLNMFTNSRSEGTQYDVSTKSSYQENAQPQNSEKIEKDEQSTLRPEDNEDTQVHRGTFSQGPYIPNPFFSHSLLTHRHAIPSAFVYPSRVGLPGNHSGFTHDVAQHSGTTPSAHLFPTPGTTVFLNVGGRLFEVLPSTFGSYPDSLLYQIFTGASTPPINQRGHIFFDRDGYLFEIILAFARLGQLTLPPRVSLTALINEAKYFGMYDYMFQQGKVPSGIPFHFQRTTCCTLGFDATSNKNGTKVFVLQGEDKLKIESLKTNGHCSLYVDLYTPSGIKETSNFLLYSPEKPDLWKAYQFCAERQLVFHVDVGNGKSGDPSLEESNASIYIVFAQTFVFHGDEFIP